MWLERSKQRALLIAVSSQCITPQPVKGGRSSGITSAEPHAHAGCQGSGRGRERLRAARHPKCNKWKVQLTADDIPCIAHQCVKSG